jgi:GntR family transcriptional regulator
MRIHLSIQDGVPIYRQIVNQVKYLVASRGLEPGEELPPIRTLAEQLLINPNTVARAYRELEVAGIVRTRRGAGTYVAEGSSPLARKEQRSILRQRIDALLAEARHLDFELDDVIAVLRERDAALDKKKQQTPSRGRGEP